MPATLKLNTHQAKIRKKKHGDFCQGGCLLYFYQAKNSGKKVRLFLSVTVFLIVLLFNFPDFPGSLVSYYSAVTGVVAQLAGLKRSDFCDTCCFFSGWPLVGIEWESSYAYIYLYVYVMGIPRGLVDVCSRNLCTFLYSLYKQLNSLKPT